MSKHRRGFAQAAGAAAIIIASGMPAAWAGSAGTPIGPNQHFIGLVNGRHVGAQIRVICPGPSNRPGPPEGGQTFAVRRIRLGGGDTGVNGRTIYAYLPGGPAALVPFSNYDSPKPIPMTARLPCSGTGTVYFTTCPLPQPCGSGSKSDNVKVTFVNIAR